jgi:hypothetical protein
MLEKFFGEEIEKKMHLLVHETKRRVLIKFGLILAIFVVYFLFIARQYGIGDGFLVALLSWSFFVLCTPIADAGFLIDFPLRLITKIKMLFLEIAVWIFAISLNLYAFFFNPEIYAKTELLKLFEKILENPFPFWGIIVISMIGTFVSINFGDELMDTVSHSERNFHAKHKNKHRFIVMIFLFAIAFAFYEFLIKKIGINFSF